MANRFWCKSLMMPAGLQNGSWFIATRSSSPLFIYHMILTIFPPSPYDMIQQCTLKHGYMYSFTDLYLTSHCYPEAAETGSQNLNRLQGSASFIWETIDLPVNWMSMDCCGRATKTEKAHTLSHFTHVQHSKTVTLSSSDFFLYYLCSVIFLSLSVVIFMNWTASQNQRQALYLLRMEIQCFKIWGYLLQG